MSLLHIQWYSSLPSLESTHVPRPWTEIASLHENEMSSYGCHMSYAMCAPVSNLGFKPLWLNADTTEGDSYCWPKTNRLLAAFLAKLVFCKNKQTGSS